MLRKPECQYVIWNTIGTRDSHLSLCLLEFGEVKFPLDVTIQKHKRPKKNRITLNDKTITEGTTIHDSKLCCRDIVIKKHGTAIKIDILIIGK